MVAGACLVAVSVGLLRRPWSDAMTGLLARTGSPLAAPRHSEDQGVTGRPRSGAPDRGCPVKIGEPAWTAKSGGDDDPAELDGHVVIGWFGLHGVPAGPSPVTGHVVGGVPVQRIPDGHQTEADQP